MKRPPKSFVVEHKRRSRGGSSEVASIWSDSAGRKLRSLMRTGGEEIVRTRTHEAGIFASPKDNEEARPVSTGRILEAQSFAVLAPEPATSDAVSMPRRRGRPPRAPAAPKALEEFGADEPTAAGDPPLTSELLTDTKASSARLRTPRPSYLERRAAARKALPIGERWRWDLDF